MLLIALAVLQHSPGLLLGTPRVSAMPASAERGEAATNGAVLLPAMRQVGATVRAGDPPTWNEHSRLGEPFAVSGAPLAWPPFWLLAAWPTPWVLELLLCLHAAFACITAYRFLRVLSISRYGAFVGGGLYGLGWFMTVALDRLPEAAAAAILPLCLELLWRCLFARRRLRIGAALGAALWAMFATGGTTTATLGAGLVVTTLAFGLTSIDRQERIVALQSVGLGALIAVLLLAPQWLDHLQLESALRADLAPTPRHLQPVGTAGALVPGLFGDDATRVPEPIRSLNPGADALELALYPGALVLFLSLLGLLRPKRTLQPLYWLVIASIGLMLALDGPLSDFLAETLDWAPRRPGASLAILHLAVVVLASLGIENFFDAPRARRFALPIAGAVCLLIAGLSLVAMIPGSGPCRTRSSGSRGQRTPPSSRARSPTSARICSSRRSP